MSVSVGQETWIRLSCDAGNECKYRPDSGTMGGYEGQSIPDVLQQAKQRGWLVDGDIAICPDCVPGFRV